MAVFTEESARANVRVRDGKRVFYLADTDHLTPAAREWLRQNQVEILPAAMAKPKEFKTLDGASLTEKPEHMTHLRADVLVPKNHPRILFRGAVDTLEAELLLAGSKAMEYDQHELVSELKQILEFVRRMIRCDVLEEPLTVKKLCGLSMEEIRERSHLPQRYYDQPHFMPEAEDGPVMLQLNRTRTAVRALELAAYEAFRDRDGNVTRRDLLMGINRLSSLIWILMIRMKKEGRYGQRH